MGVFYFDDSVHDRPGSGFVLGALVYAEADPQPVLDALLRRYGLVPGDDEFSSGIQFAGHPERIALRDELHGVLADHFRLAVTVVPRSHRQSLGAEALFSLEEVLGAFDLGCEPHDAYFDQGIALPREKPPRVAERCRVLLQQNSKSVLGIQVADLAAHSCSRMLKEALGERKPLPLPAEWGGGETSLGFELWAGLRWQFFKGKVALPDADEEADLPALGYGLRVAPTCDESLRAAALRRFGAVYMGCTV